MTHEQGQELLDTLGVNYKLGERELVELSIGGTNIEHIGSYVNTAEPHAEFSTGRGYVKRPALEKYIEIKKQNQKGGQK